MSQMLLLVEDDKDVIFLYKTALIKTGYKIIVVEDGQKGYEELHKGGYDAILLDIALPKMNGLELLQKLKANPPEVKNGPVIILTNLAKDKLKYETKDLGVADVIVKSDHTPTDIVKIVDKAIENSG